MNQVKTNMLQLSTLERKHLEFLYQWETEKPALGSLRTFLELPSTKSLHGMNQSFLDHFYDLICDTPPHLKTLGLWVEILDKIKNHPSPDKVEILIATRTLLINFTHYLESSTDEQLKTYKPQRRQTPSAVELFYLDKLEENARISTTHVSDLARFMLDSRDQFTQQDNDIFLKILKNTQRFLTSPLTVSGYYRRMVEHMRISPGLEQDLLVLNKITLRYISSKQNI